MVLNREVVTFLLCGGAAAFINWAARIVFSLSMPFEIAVVLAYLVGMTAGFVLYRGIVWRAQGATTASQIVTFIVVNAASAVIVFGAAIALRLAMSKVFGAHAFVDAGAHAFAIGLGAVTNFVGHRTFTFRQHA